MFLLVAAYSSQAIAVPMLRGELSSSYNYPVSAMNHGDEGAVLFSASVSPEGKVYRCDILRSSGTPSLDNATCATVRRKRVDPARDVTGAPVYGIVTGWIDWTLNGRPASTYRPGASSVDFYIDKMPRYALRSTLRLNLIVDQAGRIDGCYVAESTGRWELDSVACEQARGFSQLAAMRDASGQPVRSAQSLNVRFHTGAMPPN